MTKATTSSLTLLPGHVSLASLRSIYAAPVQLSLDRSARALMQA